MNKRKQLIKRLGIEAGVIAAILFVLGGLMLLTGSMATSAATKKTNAESGLNQDTSQLASVRSQFDRSGEAEKRFVQIQLNRNNSDFSNQTATFKDWLRDVKTRYRFANNFKLNLPPEITSDKSELTGLDYDIKVRPGVEIELEAISDLHVYSFVDDLLKNAPGLVRPTLLELERKGDLSPQTTAQLMAGLTPTLVTAKLKFDWIGINPKEKASPVAAAQGVPATDVRDEARP